MVVGHATSEWSRRQVADIAWVAKTACSRCDFPRSRMMVWMSAAFESSRDNIDRPFGCSAVTTWTARPSCLACRANCENAWSPLTMTSSS